MTLKDMPSKYASSKQMMHMIRWSSGDPEFYNYMLDIKFGLLIS